MLGLVSLLYTCTTVTRDYKFIRVHHDLFWSVCNEIQTADSVESVLQSELVKVLSVDNQPIEIFKREGKIQHQLRFSGKERII